MTIEQFKDKVLPFMLLHEGGYSNRKADNGGETYRGVTRKNNPDWEGWAMLAPLKPKNGDIFNHAGLKEAVADLYYKKYFKANKFDEIESPIVALCLFDLAVNGGYSVAVVQAALISAIGSNIKKDGEFGPKTLAAINSANPLVLCKAINDYRETRFHRIVERDASQEVFLEGWINRVRKLNAQIRKG